MEPLPRADLLSLVESFHIADRKVAWLNDDTVVYRSSAGLVFLNVHTAHQQLLTIPLPYLFDAFTVTLPPPTPTSPPSLIAVALHAETSVIHVYSYPALTLLHTLPASPSSASFTSLAFLPSSSSQLLAASSTSFSLYDLPTSTLLTSSPLPPTHLPPSSLLPNPFHPSHVLSLSSTTAAVHLLTPLSSYQPPLLHHLSLPLPSSLFSTSITSSLWLSPTTLLLLTSTGHVHLADLSLPPVPRVGRLGSAGQAALQAAQEVQLPVTDKEIEQLGLLPDGTEDGGEGRDGEGGVGGGEMGVGVTRMVCALTELDPAWVPVSTVLTKQHIIVGTQSGALVFLDPTSFTPMYTLTPPSPSPFVCLAFNPAYSALLTLTHSGRMQLFHASTPRQSSKELTPQPLTAPPPTPSPPSFFPSAVGDFSVAPLQGREAATVLVIPDPPSSPTYRAVVYSGATVQVWGYCPRVLLSSFTLPSPVTAGCVTPDGLLALLGLSTGAVCVLSLSPFTSPPRLVYAQVLHSSPVLHAAYAAGDTTEADAEDRAAGGMWCTMSEGEVWWMRVEDLKVVGHVRVREALNRTGAAVSAAALAEKERLDEERRQREEDEAFFSQLLHKGKITTRPDQLATESEDDRPLTFTWLSDGKRLLVSSHQRQALLLTAPFPHLEVDGFTLREETIRPVFLHTEGKCALLCPHTRGERWYAAEGRTVVIYELKGAGLRMVSRAEGHLADITALTVSPCGRYLLTGGEDGLLLVRNAETLALISSTSVARHDAGGVHSLSVSSDSAYALVTGSDGSTAAWHLVPLHEHSLARVTQPPPQPTWAPIIDPKVLENLPTLTPPTASTPTFLSLFAPTTVPTLPPVLSTQREALLTSFHTLRALVDATRTRHSLLPPTSHLPWSSLTLDTPRLTALLEDSERQVKERGAAIEREVVGAELVCERIREECWASMVVKGQVVVGLKEEEEGVRNFPLRVRREEEVRRMRQLQFMRELELCERRWRWVSMRGGGSGAGGGGAEGGERERPSSPPAPAQENDVSVWSRAYCEGVEYVLHSEDAQHAEADVVEEAVGGAGGGSGPGTAGSTRGEDVRTRSAGGGKEGKKEGGLAAGKGVRTVTVSVAFDSHLTSVTFVIPSFYLYHPLDVRTPSRQRVQSWLLLEKAIHVKLGFNAAFQDFYQQKQKDLATLVEKTKRLTEIQGELGLVDVVIPRFELRDEEVVESVLTVSDKEMAHARGMGGERVQQGGGVGGDEKTVEAELALMEMMNGSVESKRDLSLLEAELTPAEWMAKAVAEMSEEEKAELARFEKKVKMIEGEKESRRKMLQGEFNKTRSDCVDISRAFDVKVRAMREQRHRAMREVLHIEWLRQRLRVAEERHRAAKRQQRRTDARRAQTEALQGRLHEKMDTFRVDVESAQATYEALGSEVKQLERALRKEVTDAGENYDHLCKLYRIKRAKPSLQTSTQMGRRSSLTMNPSVPRHRARNSVVSIALAANHGPKASLFGIEGLTGAGLNVQTRGNRRRSMVTEEKHGGDAEDEESMSLNPYGEVAATAAAVVVEEEHLPPFHACDLDAPPPDLNASLWVRFVERRRLVVEKELEVKARLARLQDMHRFYMRMQSVDEWLQRTLDEADQQALQGVGEHPAWDVSLMLRMQQGLVEMSDTDVVQQLDEVELRGRAEVEELNRAIRAKGAAKLQLMSSMHEYEQERRLLEWRHRMLQLQFEQQADVTTQLHLLRVTKHMQTQLQEREEGRGEALLDQLHSTVQALERKMEHIRVSTRQLNAERQVELSRLQRRARKVGAENGELTRRVELLKEAVAQRKAIDELREEGVKEKVEEDVHKMRGVVARRRLVDLAHLQREEIAWLRGQVEGLRKKTFASFAHVTHTRRAEEEKQGLHHHQQQQQRAHSPKKKDAKLTLPAL